MSDLDVYVSIAGNLGESGWSNVLAGLDAETFNKLKTALDSVKEVADVKEDVPTGNTDETVAFLAGRFDKVVKALRAQRKRLETIDARLSAVEAGGGGGGGGLIPKASPRGTAGSATTSRGGASKGRARPLKSQAAASGDGDDAKESSSGGSVDDARKHYYRFGSRNLQVIKPLEGYPNRADARKEPVHGDLSLTWVHGYNGQSDNARQNICVTPDGNYLIYFIAAVGIVYNLADGTQQFFREHNDDLTTICLDPREGSTLVATGQKDPKDTPGQGKDLPKVWIWDYTNCRKVKLLDEICWGKVARVQWSKNGNLYVVGGDPDQTLKIFDSKGFTQKGKCAELLKQPTTKEQILGFVLHPNPNTDKFVDEMVIYGKRKLFYGVVLDQGGKLQFKVKNVSLSGLKKDGEKAYTSAVFLPDGRYVAGSSSGAVYVCSGSQPQAVVAAHDKAVGDLWWTGQLLMSSAADNTIKKFELDKKGNGKKPIKEIWSSGPVTIAGSDFKLIPKCAAYDAVNDVAYIGSKTNQIMRYECKTEDASLVIDGHDGSVWGLATHPKKNLFVTGGYDNAIKLWDAETRKCVDTFEFELDEGDKKGLQISCAAWSNDGEYIAVGSEQSKIAIFASEPLRLLALHEIPPKSANAAVEAVSYLRFSADSSMLGAAHMDSNLYIFSIAPAPDGITLERWPPLPHVAAPTNIQFSEDGTFVKTLTRDYEVCHWRLNSDKQKGKFYPGIPLPEDVAWADDPLIAGWDVEGLYQPGWDGTDLNDATVTSDGSLIVSGDDYGIVRLHNYPAIAPESKKEYNGHAEFVVGVEFLRDDSQLITCGGDDMAIMQWTLTKNS